MVVLWEGESEMLMTRLRGIGEAVVELLAPVGKGCSLSRACGANAIGAACVVASVVC